MNVSVCFPSRSDGGHRDRLAEWVLKRWTMGYPDWELIRGECDAGPFNRSQAINRAVAQATGDILIIADLDIIFHKPFVDDAVARVEADENAWGFAFTDYVKLVEPYTEYVLDKVADIDLPVEDVVQYEWSDSTMSGLVVVSRTGFNTVGGFDEGFRGWGYEDLGFAHSATKALSAPFRVDGYVLHLWHKEPPKLHNNEEFYNAKYLGIFKPQPQTLPNWHVGEPYPTQQMTAQNRAEPITWTAVGLPSGLEIDRDGEIAGTPLRHEQTTAVVTGTDAEGIAVHRAYPDIGINPPNYRSGKHEVGVYCYWDETFRALMTRLRWATPGLTQDNCYKSLHFCSPADPHKFALVLNDLAPLIISEGRQSLRPGSNVYVLIFEPPEIIGQDHPWLNRHSLTGSNIYMFSSGTKHPEALGLHLPQATLSPPDCIPSSKPHRCSMICSDSNVTPYHKKRREVLLALRNTDLDIHFYGRGMSSVSVDPRLKGPITTLTKDAALRPYTFTIDFENSARDVMTDKFIDPILSGTIPVTNSTGAAKVFPEGSFEYIDFDLTVPKIVDRIAEIITQPAEAILRYDRPLTRAKRLVSTGPVNICEWLYRKIEKL